MPSELPTLAIRSVAGIRRLTNGPVDCRGDASYRAPWGVKSKNAIRRFLKQKNKTKNRIFRLKHGFEFSNLGFGVWRLGATGRIGRNR